MRSTRAITDAESFRREISAIFNFVVGGMPIAEIRAK